jgi:secreted trypsin-like serine protease
LESSPHLLSGEVTIESRDKCDVTSNKLTSTTLCAGPYSVNGCETDDGSPLVCGVKVHALIDFRQPKYCSETFINRLGTYVDLSEFHDWIAEHSTSSKVTIQWITVFLGLVSLKLTK